MSLRITLASISIHFFYQKHFFVVKVTFETEVGTRLHQFLLIKNISQVACAQLIEVSRGHLNDVLHGRKGAGSDIVMGVAKAYKDLNLRWLLTGEGPMFEPERIYSEPPDELPPGVKEGVKIEYLKQNGGGELERMKRLLHEHEQRLRALENQK